MPSNDAQHIQEVKQQKGSTPPTSQPKPTPKPQASKSPQPISAPKPFENDRIFVEAASDRRGAQLADATIAASYRKASHLIKSGYVGPLAQAAMQELADEWNDDDILNSIALGETITEGSLPSLPSAPAPQNYFALPGGN